MPSQQTLHKVYVYDRNNLRPVVREVLGLSALQWFDRNYTECAAAPKQCAGFDSEFPDGRLQRELPLAMAASRSHKVQIVPSPEQADGVLWLVWDYAFCLASGARPLAWERGKGRLTASCAAHVALLKWLQTTPRWRLNSGRDFALIVDDPRRWQEALGRGIHVSWFTNIAKERYASSVGSFADHETIRSAADVLSTVMRSSILFSTEDRRRLEDRGASHLITMPYYCSPSFYRHGGRADGGTHMASASTSARRRPLLASFVGTVEVHNDCAVCENDVEPRDLRVKVADELSRHCMLAAAKGMFDGCALVALDALRFHRDDRQGLAAAGVSFAQQLRDAIFCPIPRGDSASTKRFYASIQAGCVPVVISDRFIPAFAKLLASDQAMVHIGEADFLNRSFSFTRFLQLVHSSGHAALLAKGRELRIALSYQHSRSAVGREDSRLSRSRRQPDAVDYLATEFLNSLSALGTRVASVPVARPLLVQPSLPLLYARAQEPRPSQPYMIFADERTGSTSLCWALDQHPQIKCDHELFKNEWMCTELLRYVHLLPSPTDAESERGACGTVLSNLSRVVEGYWARCSYGACGGKVFPANLPVSHTVHDLFKQNRFAFGARVIKLVRLDKHAQYTSRIAARASGDWGSTPALRAAAQTQRRARRQSPRAKHAPLINGTDFELFQREQLAWQRQVEELRPMHYFLRIFTEELVGGGRLNKTTLNRIAAHIGVDPFSARLLHSIQARQRAGTKVSWRRFYKNESHGVGS